jgi:hypothetical protein
MGCKSRDSCKNLHKKFAILPLKSQFILSLLLFVVNNKDLFMTNPENHNICTTHGNHLHLPLASLTIYQHVIHYSYTKIFNKPPLEIKNKKSQENPVNLRNIYRNSWIHVHFIYWTNSTVLGIHAYIKEIWLQVCWHLQTQFYFKIALIFI